MTRAGWLGSGWRQPASPQRAASDLGASPFGRRPQAPLSCDLRLNHAVRAWFKTPAIRVTVLALSTGVGSCSGFCLPRSGGISLPGGASPRVTHRAALGGTLTARELLVGGSGFHVGLSFYYPLRCRASVAVFPLVLRARRVAWSERLRPCHWRLAMPGFPCAVLIPLGRLQTFPILLLARGPLWFHHLHLRAGHIHARRISESIEAVAIA